LAYPPGAPTEIHYVRPVARTVNFASNNSIYVIPPSPSQRQPEPGPPPQQKQSPPEPPQQPQTPPKEEPEQEQHHDAPQPQPQPQTEQPGAEAEPPAQTQDPPPPAEPKPPKVPKRGKKKHSGRVRFGPEPAPPPQQQQQEEQPQQEEHDDTQGPGDSGSAPGQQQGPHGAAPSPAQGRQGYLHLLRYTPSPLPRWEATPRRHEYFSGEYRSYYPTPVREGIYRIATDANRLTTIFSEENPNACTIV
jgi:hypothetical protein